MQSFETELTRKEFAAIVAYVTESAGRDVGESPADDETLEAGEQVFEQHCQACHRIADRSIRGTPDWPGTDFTKVKPSARYVERIVFRRYAFMAYFRGKLSTREVRDVAAYVHAVAGKKGPPTLD